MGRQTFNIDSGFAICRGQLSEQTPSFKEESEWKTHLRNVAHHDRLICLPPEGRARCLQLLLRHGGPIPHYIDLLFNAETTLSLAHHMGITYLEGVGLLQKLVPVRDYTRVLLFEI